MSTERSIQLSQRLLALPPYVFGRLNKIKSARRKAGEDIIDLGMGNPNDPPPQLVIDKLCEAVQEPKNHRYSVQADGITNLKKEVAAFYRREYEVELDPEKEVVCTIGSKEGLSHLFLALFNPGDVAVVPVPAFPVHIHGVHIAGGSVISFPISNGPEYFQHLRQILESFRPKPKLLIANFPHNPTTLTVELDFYEELVNICRDHGVFIIQDFAYSHITFDGYRAPSVLQVPGAKEIAVEFSTMSKTFSMAGWRLGFCVGNEQMVSALARIKGYFDYGLFMPIQIAGIVAMRHCRQEAAQVAAAYQSRRDALCDGLDRIGWHFPRPRGTMFAWAPLPEKYAHMGSLDFSMLLLEKANVAVAPGEAFGPGGERFVRMAIVENELRLKQAARQMGRALELKE